MSVEQLVGQGRFTHVGLWQSYSAKDREAVEWALASTGLAGLAARGPKEFSGGERHRAWIAASLAQEADILILDGPTSFLDIGHQVEVLELLVRLNQERGVTVIMAMHDINQAMMVSESTSLLDRGVLEFSGLADSLASSGLVESTFEVQGEFIAIRKGGAPHFEVEIAGRRRR